MEAAEQLSKQSTGEEPRAATGQPRRQRAGDSRYEAASAAWRLMSDYSHELFRSKSSVLQDLGLTPGHMKALMALDPGAARPMGSCASHMGCDASTATWLIDRLEERDLVERRPLKRDRRVKAVALTPNGAATRDRLLEHLYEPPPAFLELDEASLRTLTRILRRLCGEEPGADPSEPATRERDL